MQLKLGIRLVAQCGNLRRVSYGRCALTTLSSECLRFHPPRGAIDTSKNGTMSNKPDELNGTMSGKPDELHGAMADNVDKLNGAMMDNVAKLIGDITDKVDELEGGIINKVDELEGGIIDKVDELEGGIIDKVDELEGGIIDKVDELNGGMIDTVDELNGGMADRVDELNDSMADRVNELIRAMADNVDVLKRRLEAPDMTDNVDTLKRRLQKAVNEAERLKEQAELEKKRADRAEAQQKVGIRASIRKRSHHIELLRMSTNACLTPQDTVVAALQGLPCVRIDRWTDGVSTLRDVQDTMYGAVPESLRCDTLSDIAASEARITDRMITSEDDLAKVLVELMEWPVARIMNTLKDVDAFKQRYDIGSGISFATQTNVLETESVDKKSRFEPHCICACKAHSESAKSAPSIAYVAGLEPCHELTLKHLRDGLRPMDIFADVANRTRPHSESPEYDQYDAELRVASTITQTFNHMLKSGLAYGCIITGEAFVLLKFDRSSKKLLYHLVDQETDVGKDGHGRLFYSALSQVIAFTVLALHEQSKAHVQLPQQWKLNDEFPRWNNALPSSRTATHCGTSNGLGKEYTSRKRDKNAKFQKLALSSSAESQYEMSESFETAIIRMVKTFKLPRDLSCRASELKVWAPKSLVLASEGDESNAKDSSAEYDGSRSQLSMLTLWKTLLRLSLDPHRSKSIKNVRWNESSTRQYCTHKCLLGLISGDVLDDECPNVSLHRNTDGDNHHRIDHGTWLRMLHYQMLFTYAGIVPLGIQGTRGAALQVTLLGLGYTVIAKATTAQLIPHLEHEAKVYERLRHLQGHRIPVFLGACDLREFNKKYMYDVGARLVHFMLLSWAGHCLEKVEMPDKHVAQHFMRETEEILGELGVTHKDMRPANVMWDATTERMMLIDFERAKLGRLRRRRSSSNGTDDSMPRSTRRRVD